MDQTEASLQDHALVTRGNTSWLRYEISLPFLIKQDLIKYLLILGKRGDRRVLLQYCERRNDLCRTLHTLDVANTGVTSGGILLALHRAPALQSLGEYAHTGRALEVLERVKSAPADPANTEPQHKYVCLHF